MTDVFDPEQTPFPERDPIANQVVIRGLVHAHLLPVGAKRFGPLRQYARAACGYPLIPTVCQEAPPWQTARCSRCRHSKLGRLVRP
jgi:hypothetical protein